MEDLYKYKYYKFKTKYLDQQKNLKGGGEYLYHRNIKGDVSGPINKKKHMHVM